MMIDFKKFLVNKKER